MSETVLLDTSLERQGQAELSGALVQLLRRYAADLPAAQQNDVDRAVARALDPIPDVRKIARRMTRRVQTLPATERATLLTPAFAALPLSHAIGRDTIAGAFGKFAKTPVDPPAATTHRYELRFSHVTCVDETNPEFFGSDEVYVVFGWITQDMADQGIPPRVVRTPVYEDMDDGDRKPRTGSQNLRAFGPRTMGDGLVFTATCFEHDLGDIAETMNDIGVALGVAAGAATLIGPIVASAVAIAAAVSSLIGKLGADVQIGDTVSLRLSQRNADDRTAAAASVMLPFLEHRRGDGHYRTFLQLRRV